MSTCCSSFLHFIFLFYFILVNFLQFIFGIFFSQFPAVHSCFVFIYLFIYFLLYFVFLYSTITVFLLGLLWYLITHEGWYVIILNTNNLYLVFCFKNSYLTVIIWKKNYPTYRWSPNSFNQSAPRQSGIGSDEKKRNNFTLFKTPKQELH